jgi:DNA-binding MarR family transcriptional regulator
VLDVAELDEALVALVRRMLAVRVDGDVERLERTAYAVLAVLHDTGPQRLSGLAAHLQLDKSTVSRQLDALQERGMAERLPDPDDRRAQQLALTERGRRALRAVRAQRRRMLREAVGDWSDQDLDALVRLLRRLHHDLFDHTDLPVAAGPP